jgi:hypothetical protein
MSGEFQEVMKALRSKIADQPADVETPKQTPQWYIESGAHDVIRPEPKVRSHEFSPAQRTMITSCVESALDLMGRTGKDVFFELLWRRHGVTKDDIIDNPGKFMTALKVLLDSSAFVLETYALDEIERNLKISAYSLEDAIAKLRARSIVPGTATEGDSTEEAQASPALQIDAPGQTINPESSEDQNEIYYHPRFVYPPGDRRERQRRDLV